MDKRAEELAALKAKIESAIPGYEVPPNHPPQGIIVNRNCEKCSGTGWRYSERYERFVICECCTKEKPKYIPRLPYPD